MPRAIGGGTQAVRPIDFVGGLGVRTPVLFNFQGTNGDTTTTNEGSATLSGLTFNGAAQISNEQAWTGTTSLKINADSANYVSFQPDDAPGFTEDWTVEFFEYHTTAITSLGLLANNSTVRPPKFIYCALSGNRWPPFHDNSQISTGFLLADHQSAWNHFAFQHRADVAEVDCFFNGTRDTVLSAGTGEYEGTSGLNLLRTLRLGRGDTLAGPHYLGAFRMVAGKAVYGDVATYTVPTGPLGMITA